MIGESPQPKTSHSEQDDHEDNGDDQTAARTAETPRRQRAHLGAGRVGDRTSRAGRCARGFRLLGDDARPSAGALPNGLALRPFENADRTRAGAAVGRAFVAVGLPAAGVVAAAVFGADDDLVAGDELLLAQGASLPQKGRGIVDVMGADHGGPLLDLTGGRR